MTIGALIDYTEDDAIHPFFFIRVKNNFLDILKFSEKMSLNILSIFLFPLC